VQGALTAAHWGQARDFTADRLLKGDSLTRRQRRSGKADRASLGLGEPQGHHQSGRAAERGQQTPELLANLIAGVGHLLSERLEERVEVEHGERLAVAAKGGGSEMLGVELPADDQRLLGIGARSPWARAWIRRGLLA
jgi:hypothetical protein